MVRQAENFAAMMGQAISLGWIGSLGHRLCRRRPLLERPGEGRRKTISNKFIEKNVGRLPVAVRIDASNPLKLAMFLTTARAFIEQTSPGLTHWESLKYKDQPYVRITPVKGGGACPGRWRTWRSTTRRSAAR